MRAVRGSAEGVHCCSVSATRRSAPAEVVDALHQLVAETRTLVDLDVMEEGAPNLNVLQLNGTEAVKSLDLSRRGLGPLSAAVIAACVKSNGVLEELR